MNPAGAAPGPWPRLTALAASAACLLAVVPPRQTTRRRTTCWPRSVERHALVGRLHQAALSARARMPRFRIADPGLVPAQRDRVAHAGHV